MGDGRLGAVERLQNATEAIESLQSTCAAEGSLEVALLRVATSATIAIADADAVSVTVLGSEAARTAAYTDEWVLRLDEEQYASGRGPCLEAAELRQPVRLAVDVAEQRFPEFVGTARDCGISATLSMPLMAQVDDDCELIGSLNVYSRTLSAFDPFDETLVLLYTTAAGHAITNARRWAASRATADQLARALSSRSEIDQAKGALRAVHGCSENEAFERLVAESQNRNLKLHAVAREFLERLQAAE
jgi:hypothetical protein